MTRELDKGDRLGEYEIVRRLRSGGMATLFLGRRHGAAGVTRHVAIKVIHPHLAEDELIVKMFIDEARISSHISHSNVVYLEKFGEQNGVYYIVMEYVEGCSLEQLLKVLVRRGEELSPEAAVHVALEVAAGLHAAHETTDEGGAALGIVHRDVSPSNVLLARDGRIKVIDFGIAKARNRLGQTRSGASLKGKLRYMSPEQARGQEIDRRTDVYALGIVLWEVLTRRPLFRAGDDLELLDIVRDPKIPPPSTVNPKVSAAIDAIVLRATAKDRAHRQATAQELRQELMRAVPGAVSIPPETFGQLVMTARTELGIVTNDPEDEKATTPATPVSKRPVEGSDSSVRARGELEAARRPRRARTALAIGGIAIACTIAGFAASRLVAREPQTAPPPAPPAPLAVQPATPVDAAPVAPTIDAAQVVAPAPVPPRHPAPPRRGPRTLEVDGATLADKPGSPVKPTKPPAKPREVEVDGTVLAP
jgi:serine/threonine protein kinase